MTMNRKLTFTAAALAAALIFALRFAGGAGTPSGGAGETPAEESSAEIRETVPGGPPGEEEKQAKAAEAVLYAMDYARTGDAAYVPPLFTACAFSGDTERLSLCMDDVSILLKLRDAWFEGALQAAFEMRDAGFSKRLMEILGSAGGLNAAQFLLTLTDAYRQGGSAAAVRAADALKEAGASLPVIGPDEEIYIGEYAAGGVREGFGICLYGKNRKTDTRLYIGEFKGGMRSGNGKAWRTASVSAETAWENDLPVSSVSIPGKENYAWDSGSPAGSLPKAADPSTGASVPSAGSVVPSAEAADPAAEIADPAAGASDLPAEVSPDTYAAYALLLGGQAEQAAALLPLPEAGIPDLTRGMGLVKAELMADNAGAALTALRRLKEAYPDSLPVTAYLGYTLAETGAYGAAADTWLDCIDSLGREESEGLRTQLLLSLWQSDDDAEILRISRELYRKFPEEYGYLSNYVRAAALLPTAETREQLLSDLAGTVYGTPVSVMLEAYDCLLRNEPEKAAELLSAPELLLALPANGADIWFGETEEGVLQGTCVGFAAMFGTRGAFLGTMRDGRPEGTCTLFTAEQSETETSRGGTVRQGTKTLKVRYDAAFSAGVPEGSMTEFREISRTFPEEPSFDYTGAEQTVYEMKDGKAEGKAVTVLSSFHEGSFLPDGTEVTHVFSAGVPVPFPVQLKDGEHMVTELTRNSFGEESFETEDCGHRCIYRT